MPDLDDRPSSRFECPQREIVSLSLSSSLYLRVLFSEIRLDSIRFFFHVYLLQLLYLVRYLKLLPDDFFRKRFYRVSTECFRQGFSAKNPFTPRPNCSYIISSVRARLLGHVRDGLTRARHRALAAPRSPLHHVGQREPETGGRGAPPPSPSPSEDTAVLAGLVPGNHAALVLVAAGRLVQSGCLEVRFSRVSI